jgi:hypothetical protein
MYKRLRIYYLYTATPFVLLLLSAVFYREAIVKTIVSNPHPQINYLIFIITLVGGTLVLMSIKKLMKEAKQLSDFTATQREGADKTVLQKMAFNSDADIAYVLRMVAASSGRAISHQEQIALENELHKTGSRLNSRNAIPQFLGGLLVGMGLLGTFIGLLATLDDIATLISSFGSLDMKTADPIAVFAQMVKLMEAPMHSMGIAFSASMYGLLGSIIIGFMMVSVRRCMGEIMSLLGSEVAQHIAFALERDESSHNKTSADLALTTRVGAPLVISDLSAANVNVIRAESAETSTEEVTKYIAPRKVADQGDNTSEEIRVLRRIEERLADSTRLQEQNLAAEIDDFNKQRGDMLRALAENAEASVNFRAELQRVGRQLGVMLDLMGKGNIEVVTQVRDIKLLMKDDATETHRLLGAMIEVLQK